MKMQNITTRLLLSLLCVHAFQTLYAENVPCLIEPDQTIEMGSPVVGIVKSIHVERGDTVKKGQIIAILNHAVESRALTLSKARATDYTEVRSAKKASEHASRELTRTQAMVAKQLVSQQFLDKATVEASLAKLQLEQAQANLKEAKLEQKLAETRLKERTLTSPIKGLIADRYVSLGQRIQEQPLVKVIKTDPLRVEVIVPDRYFNRYKIGDTLNIKPQLEGLPYKQAVVTIVDRIIDTASNTFRLTLSLPNPDHAIPPGARCSVDLSQTINVAQQ